MQGATSVKTLHQTLHLTLHPAFFHCVLRTDPAALRAHTAGCAKMKSHTASSYDDEWHPLDDTVRWRIVMGLKQAKYE